MARLGHGLPEPDPYQLLGVARQATAAEIAQAWRRKARAEHPDARPQDAGAPARFRALAEAYQVLSDPARRAAYDQAAARVPAPETRAGRPSGETAVRVIVLSPSTSPLPSRAASSAPARGAPLWAGPVRVEPPAAPLARGAARDERARLMFLAEVAARYLDAAWDWPW
jgi:curved DNA-binding protein CbpA